MRVIGQMINEMDMVKIMLYDLQELNYITMVKNMKGSGRTMQKQAKETIATMMVTYITVNLMNMEEMAKVNSI